MAPKRRALGNGLPVAKQGEQQPPLSRTEPEQTQGQQDAPLQVIECTAEFQAEWIANLNKWRRRREIRVHEGLSWMQYASAIRVQMERREKARLARFAVLARARVARLRKKRCPGTAAVSQMVSVRCGGQNNAA